MISRTIGRLTDFVNAKADQLGLPVALLILAGLWVVFGGIGLLIGLGTRSLRSLSWVSRPLRLMRSLWSAYATGFLAMSMTSFWIMNAVESSAAGADEGSSTSGRTWD